MKCQDCPRYDPQRRCLDGKVNPRSWRDTVEVANVLGVRAICPFNDHREKLVLSRKPGMRATKPGRPPVD